MKEFVTAVLEETEVEERKKAGVKFKIDDQELVAHKPNDGQVALLMARMGRHSTSSDRVAGIIDFFVEVLDEQGHEYIVNRLMDGDDEFGITDVSSIMEWLLAEWSGRPTK